MLEFILIILFCGLFFKVLKLAFKVAWGATKIAASVLLVIACPMLILGAIFVGGLVLLIPIALIAIAFGLLKACI